MKPEVRPNVVFPGSILPAQFLSKILWTGQLKEIRTGFDETG